MSQTRPIIDAPERVCTFTLGRQYFGIDVMRVQEVIRGPSMTPVPLSAPEVAGLINLRGQIVMAIDLRVKLARSPRGSGLTPVHLILSTDDGLVSLLVDEVEEIVELRNGPCEPAPETLEKRTRDLIQGVCLASERLLLILDPSRIAQTTPSSEFVSQSAA